MSIERDVKKRSNAICELCGSDQEGLVYAIPSSPGNGPEYHVWICPTCKQQIENPESADPIHWRCLNESIWSETPAVQVLSWRLLHKFNHLDGMSDLLDMAYLDEENLAWAKASGDDKTVDESDLHKDCFGAILQNGDSVVLVKTLEVKGATFDAKLGTVVRKIRLVEGNPEQIEGKVNGSQIVILTKYVRKSNSKED
jgi:protein PhnA